MLLYNGSDKRHFTVKVSAEAQLLCRHRHVYSHVTAVTVQRAGRGPEESPPRLCNTHTSVTDAEHLRPFRQELG